MCSDQLFEAEKELTGAAKLHPGIGSVLWAGGDLGWPRKSRMSCGAGLLTDCTTFPAA
jgi:hypothetical protein